MKADVEGQTASPVGFSLAKESRPTTHGESRTKIGTFGLPVLQTLLPVLETNKDHMSAGRRRPSTNFGHTADTRATIAGTELEWPGMPPCRNIEFDCGRGFWLRKGAIMLRNLGNLAVLAISGLMVTNCASAPGEQSFCERNTAVCVLGGVIVVGVVGLAIAAKDESLPPAPSDARLKRNIHPVGTLPNGVHLFSFQYWNDERTLIGVVAQDLLRDERFRHAVSMGPHGYYQVDLAVLGLDVSGSREQFLEAGLKAAAEADPGRE